MRTVDDHQGTAEVDATFVTVCEQGRPRLFEAELQDLEAGRYRWVIGAPKTDSSDAPLPSTFSNVEEYRVLVGVGAPEALTPEDGVLVVRMALRGGFEGSAHAPALYSNDPARPGLVAGPPPAVLIDLSTERPDEWGPCRPDD